MIQYLSLISVQKTRQERVLKRTRGALDEQHTKHSYTHSVSNGSLTAVTQCCRPRGCLTVCKPLFASICLLVRWNRVFKETLECSWCESHFPTHTYARPRFPTLSDLCGASCELHYHCSLLHPDEDVSFITPLCPCI